MKFLLWFLAFCLAIGILVTFWPLAFIIIAVFVIWKVYETFYFTSDKFESIKDRIQSYINDCNELNRHIEDLKRTKVVTNRLESGCASYQNESRWKTRKTELSNQEYAPNVYNCSLSVCDGARRDPFKYVCKYFNIATDEDTLEKFEDILNNFEAAEEGKTSLQEEKEKILESIQTDIPTLIQRFSKKKLEKSLGFEPIDLGTAHFPKYTFKYVSPGGNKATRYDIVMDIENLNKFVQYLSERIKFKKSVAGQRALMTSKLRERIKQRDGYTCRKCGASISKEPNLLLEIDHIMPVSKGGLTTEDNLQTLCWRCNRSKGARI